jgi:hypothetical protein
LGTCPPNREKCWVFREIQVPKSVGHLVGTWVGGHQMSEANSKPELPATAPPPKKNHLWIFFFAFLFVASVGVAVIMILFNLSIQLKQGDLDKARKLWEEKGPKSYNLFYTKQVNNDDRKTVFAVKVRAGKVMEVLMNGKPLEPTNEDGEVHDPLPYHSMEGKFRDIERFMDIDQKKDAPSVYVIANFDPETGAVLKYIRSVMKTGQRVELNLRVEAVK